VYKDKLETRQTLLYVMLVLIAIISSR